MQLRVIRGLLICALVIPETLSRGGLGHRWPTHEIVGIEAREINKNDYNYFTFETFVIRVFKKKKQFSFWQAWDHGVADRELQPGTAVVQLPEEHVDGSEPGHRVLRRPGPDRRRGRRGHGRRRPRRRRGRPTSATRGGWWRRRFVLRRRGRRRRRRRRRDRLGRIPDAAAAAAPSSPAPATPAPAAPAPAPAAPSAATAPAAPPSPVAAHAGAPPATSMRPAVVPRDRRPQSRAALPLLGRRRWPGHVDVNGQQRGHHRVQKGPAPFQRHSLQQQRRVTATAVPRCGRGRSNASRAPSRCRVSFVSERRVRPAGVPLPTHRPCDKTTRDTAQCEGVSNDVLYYSVAYCHHRSAVDEVGSELIYSNASVPRARVRPTVDLYRRQRATGTT